MWLHRSCTHTDTHLAERGEGRASTRADSVKYLEMTESHNIYVFGFTCNFLICESIWYRGQVSWKLLYYVLPDHMWFLQ